MHLPDDAPEPIDAGPADEATTADELDSAYQAGIDAGLEAFKWIRAALSVLDADLLDDGDRMMADAIRDLRISAANRAARLFRSDVEGPLGDC